ncbi:tyrosine--tRNA ligase [Clostridium magnum DSM 2767]|uniref:Tyrosine--tRNA ligase n=1 Tax=Clostridium magnum DSM 2767 TaxID=1121326 RepID=A0A162UK58_9CLOT|nr:tyrosine--tRNA ligase [Clostridium magnum DSM 2767]SHI00384.1 tyrosyl-tRNA synthetase [Clostridium magnum DSM 2767]
MTITLLMNCEGNKMGKTAKGAVWLDPNKTSPFEFFQYWLNIADADVLKCMRMLTFLPLNEIDEMDKWQGSQLNKSKEILAYELTKLVHGDDEAEKARSTSHALFRGGDVDSNMPTTEISSEQLNEGIIDILDLMVVCRLASSKSEARRLVEQGGVFLNDSKVESIDYIITSEQLKNSIKIRKGKKTYHRILIK